MSTPTTSIYKTLSLEENKIPKIEKEKYLVYSAIGVLFFFIIGSLVIFWKYLYVRVYYKRYFAAYATGKWSILV